VTAEQAGALAKRAAGRVTVVGLFVAPEPEFIEAVRAEAKLDIIQLHGDEPPAFVSTIGMVSGLEVWKAIPVKKAADLMEAQKYQGAACQILYDAKPPKGVDLPGGTGIRIDWTLLTGHAHPLPWILAGGLDAGNVAEAIGITSATFVDVSSGIESAPGIKDMDKIAAFLKACAHL
jgi:phosphoribosylanthranilate isomerase